MNTQGVICEYNSLISYQKEKTDIDKKIARISGTTIEMMLFNLLNTGGRQIQKKTFKM